jgi:hypothetical protein
MGNSAFTDARLHYSLACSHPARQGFFPTPHLQRPLSLRRSGFRGILKSTSGKFKKPACFFKKQAGFYQKGGGLLGKSRRAFNLLSIPLR